MAIAEDYGHWEYDGEIDLDEWFGFVYRIINTTNDREYIGKKQFHSYTRKKIKGRKNRKKIVKESKWPVYTGSSKALNADIEAHGIENFKFIIESLHETRGSLYYEEVEKQITERVLKEKLDNGERKYYNGHIGAIKFIPPDMTNKETRAKISRTMLKNGTTVGEKNGMHGKHPHAKLSGNELAELKVKMSNPGKKNGMYGKPCYYNMTEEKKQEWKDNISKGTIGLKKHTEESRKKIAEARSKPQPQVSCPYCDKVGGSSNMRRYHFENCKK